MIRLIKLLICLNL
jgi:hypothetical protein